MALRPFLRRMCAGISRSLLICAAIAVLVPAVALAQDSPPALQAKLASVTQTGSHVYTSEQVTALSGLQIGATVDRNAIQAAADRLAHSGLFSSVRYRFSTDASGLTVTFELEDAPQFPISLDNIPWLSSDDLTNVLNQAGVSTQHTVAASGAVDDSVAHGLQSALEAKGIHATVSYSVATVPGTNDRVVQFKAAGADVRVASLQFSDPLPSHDPAVQAQLANIVGKPFSIEAIERFDFEQVRPVFLSHAYLQVKFSATTFRLSNSDSVAVTVPVEPGPVYVWGGVNWSGNHAYTTNDLNALITGAGLSVGQPADGNKIMAMWESVRNAYGHRGYIDALVEPKPTFDDAAHRASYTVDISEGDQYHMGNLVLTGLSIDAERRLREAWHIGQGQVFDQTYCNYFLATGIADTLKGLPAATATVGHFLQKNPQTKTVDVLIDFE
jgi:outer membrane protein assembly factor BamA